MNAIPRTWLIPTTNFQTALINMLVVFMAELTSNWLLTHHLLTHPLLTHPLLTHSCTGMRLVVSGSFRLI